MTAVLVQLTTRPPDPAGPTEVTVAEDVNELAESAMCSCTAGDDNPTEPQPSEPGRPSQGSLGLHETGRRLAYDPHMRTQWEYLPAAVHAAVQAHTGPVLKAASVAAGRNSDVAAVLHTTTAEVFIKGVRNNPDNRRRVVTQQREAAVNPWVRHVSPRLLWRVQISGWDVLGFERVTGRGADFSPDSGDLPVVAVTVERLTRTPAPEVPDTPIRGIQQRWAELADPAALQLLAGDTLCHTDLHPDNILTGGGQASIVDWAWPTRGAAWIDPACLALWLIAEGHTPEQAEGWAAQIPAWHTAPRTGIDLYTVAASRLWEKIADADPQPWKRRLAAAGRAWVAYRS